MDDFELFSTNCEKSHSSTAYTQLQLETSSFTLIAQILVELYSQHTSNTLGSVELSSKRKEGVDVDVVYERRSTSEGETAEFKASTASMSCRNRRGDATL